LLALEFVPRPIEIKPEFPVIRVLVRITIRVLTIVARARARNALRR
jgi:hypothetical protein